MANFIKMSMSSYDDIDSYLYDENERYSEVDNISEASDFVQIPEASDFEEITEAVKAVRLQKLLYDQFIADIDICYDNRNFPLLQTSFSLKEIEIRRIRSQRFPSQKFPNRWFPNQIFPYCDRNNIYFSPHAHSNCRKKNMMPIIQILESSNLIMTRAIWRDGWPQNIILQINTNFNGVSPSFLGKILSNNTILNIPSRLDILPAAVFSHIIAFIAMSPFDYPLFDGCMSCTF